jgi:hypothetical protein
MYGFCRIIDLGKTHFNFSSKNYRSKVYTFFAENVDLVTLSTTKLVCQFLYFSTILYRFYNLQANHEGRERIFLYTGPWNYWIFTKIPLTLTRRSLQNPHPRQEVLGGVGGFAAGEVRPVLIHKRARQACRLTSGLLVADLGRWGLGQAPMAAQWRRGRDCSNSGERRRMAVQCAAHRALV